MILWPKLSKLFLYQRDYLAFAAGSFGIVLLFSIGTATFTYFSHISSTNRAIETKAERINHVLLESFHYTENALKEMGEEVAEHNNPKDLEYIYTLFQTHTPLDAKDALNFSWSLFDWIDENAQQRVNSRKGIHATPIDMSMREYSKKCPEKPWTLQMSYPAMGIPSGLWVIPAGMGITDHSGNYLGSIIVGFNIASLTEKISQALSGSSVSFVVLDQYYNIVFQSADNQLKPTSTFYKDKIGEKSTFENSSGLLREAIADPESDIRYAFYKRMEAYPYIILTGFNEVFLWKEFVFLVLPRILEMISVGIFFVIVLYAFRSRIVQPMISLSSAANHIAKGEFPRKVPRGNTFETHSLAKQMVRIMRYMKREERYKEEIATAKMEAENAIAIAKESRDARERFALRLRQELSRPMMDMTRAAYQIAEGKLGHISEEYKVMGEILYSGVYKLSTLLTDELNLTEINPTDAIEKCFAVHKDSAYYRGVTYTAQIQKNMPAIAVDEVRFSQIVIGMAYQSLFFTIPGLKVKLKAFIEEETTTTRTRKNSKKTEKKARTLVISVQDNSMGLNEKNREKLMKNYSPTSKFDGTDMSLSSIRTLVDLHHGTFEFIPKPQKGSEFIVRIPYTVRSPEKNKLPTLPDRELPENVLPFRAREEE